MPAVVANTGTAAGQVSGAAGLSRWRPPLASELYCLGYLCWGHALRDHIPILRGTLSVLRCRQVEPHVREDIALRHATAVTVHQPEILLGECVTLVRREAIPPHRLSIALRHAAAGGILEPELELAEGVTLIRRKAI